MKKKSILTILLVWVCIGYCFSQAAGAWKDSVEVGKPFPEYHFEDIRYYNKKQASIKDFRGKWLILDFWNQYCTGCIASFPKMNELQKKFADKIEIIMVGVPHKEEKKAIESLYDRCRKDKNINLPITYDSNLAKFMNVAYFPDLVIIDPNGIVKARTPFIDESELYQLLAGENPKLVPVTQEYLKNFSDYNYQLPYLYGNNGKDYSKVLNRSLFAVWTKNIPRTIIERKGLLEALGFTVEQLYRLAFFGAAEWIVSDRKMYLENNFELVLETKDSLKIRKESLSDSALFCYSLSYPVDTSNPRFPLKDRFKNNVTLQKKVQEDLAEYLPYAPNLELRDGSYYSLTANTKANHTKSIGDKLTITQPNGHKQGTLMKNVTINDLINILTLCPGAPSKVPIIDETGITYNIDIDLSAIYFDDQIKILQENGFELTLKKKKFKTIVLRDR